MTSDEPLGRTRPLCFLHVPKTGVVSLTDALARRFPAEQVFLAPDGNLSLANLEALGARLDGPLFLAGHPVMGFVPALSGRADIITVLRRPRDQIVSLYLHVLAGPQNPFHASAIRQPFPDFLRENIGLLTFQTTSLAIALSAATPAGPAQVLDFLDGLPFVGVIERPETCADVLTRLVAADPPVELPCLNAAIYRGVSRATVSSLARAYDDLRDDPACADLIAIETRTYELAAARLDQLAAALQRERPGGRAPARADLIGPWRFRDLDGPLSGDATRHAITGVSKHLIFGPYERLPRGHYVAQFDLMVVGADAGRIEIDVLANDRAYLSQRWLPAAADWSPRRLTLGFFNPDPANVLEFRVRADRCAGGELTFRGVTIRPARLAQTWPSLIARGLRKLRPRRRRRS